MSAAFSRREDGCASDLLMDRWLLGEIPGSDEGRRLEAHVRVCTGCAARFQALRSLYGNKPLPKAEPPLPPPPAPPRVIPPEHAAVLQVVILRDGLLVGSEMFTAGRYTIGRDATCGLRLDDVEPVHAAVSLIAERVALEAAGGQVFVNGFRATQCELRPIDEVAIGPYVLRARVIVERYERVKLKAVEVEATVTERTVVVPPEPQALRLELFWGETRIDVAVMTDGAGARRFGLTSIHAIDGGFMVDGMRVVRGEAQRFHVGHLICVATAVPLTEPVAPKSVREWPWAVTSLAATLIVGVIAMGVYASGLDEDRFVSKPIELQKVIVYQPPKPPKPPPPEKHASRPQAAPPAAAGASRDVKPPKKLRLPSKILAGLDKVTKLKLDIPDFTKPGRRAETGLVASLAKPSAGGGAGKAFDLGPGGPGIGANGFGAAGELKSGVIGRRGVLGTPNGTVIRSSSPTADIDRDAVAKIINSHLSEFTRCYEQAMMKGGPFSGKMTLEWKITTAGTVSGSRVKQTDITNASFGACVLAKLNGWKFPPARGGSVVVSYPIHLNNVGY